LPGTVAWQVEDWEAAAAADPATVYPGTHAFEEQFGKGASLAQPLLVLQLDEEQAESLAEAWGHPSLNGGD
jgi:hypothetical protein